MLITLSDIITSALYMMSDNKDASIEEYIYKTSNTYRDKCTGQNMKVTLCMNYSALYDVLYDIAIKYTNEEQTNDYTGIYEYIQDTMIEDIVTGIGKFKDFSYIRIKEYNYNSLNSYKTVYSNRNRITGQNNPENSGELIVNDYYLNMILSTLLDY